MGIIRAFTGALGGAFADQWKDIITAGNFDEQTVVSPGIWQRINRGRGVNVSGSRNVISNGSKIFVPENTAAFIFSQSGIEEIIAEPGGYVYQGGQASIFSGDGIGKAIFNQIADRIKYGGKTAEEKQIAYVNMREMRGLKFGTKGALVYNDAFYGTDLEIMAFGSFSLKIVDAEKFIKNFVPPNVSFYTFEDNKARSQMLSEFLHSFLAAINALSSTYRISQLPALTNELTKSISDTTANAGTWGARFGFELVGIGIESIEFSEESRELVRVFSSNKMSLKAYEDASQKSANIAAQQRIAQGIQTHGLGDGGGMLFGMNMTQMMNPQTAEVATKDTTPASLDNQIETLKKLKDLLDTGILSQEEFESKKKEVMGL